jgi:hypothetical protein
VGISLRAYGHPDRPQLSEDISTYLLCPQLDPSTAVLPPVYNRDLEIVGHVLGSRQSYDELASMVFPAEFGQSKQIERSTSLWTAIYPSRAVIRQIREQTGLPVERYSDEDWFSKRTGRLGCCAHGIEADVAYDVPSSAGGGKVTLHVSDYGVSSVAITHSLGHSQYTFPQAGSMSITVEELDTFISVMNSRPPTDDITESAEILISALNSA